ncbi:MAG: dihydrofolate reductase family protein [Thermoplasmata archaeon]|nr:dihydrofolate reductase family protein [Thermoplasmata archaeon]
MLPNIILNKAVSVNGRIDGFERSLEVELRIYQQAMFDSYLADVHSLKRFSEMVPDDELEQAPPDFQGQEDPRARLVLIDPEGKMDTWDRISKIPSWGKRFALVTKSTPSSYIEELKRYSVECITSGEDKVDMVGALEELYDKFKCRRMLLDVEGSVSGELFKEGLVDEVNLIVYPCLVDDEKGHYLDLTELSDRDAPIKLCLRKYWSEYERHLWLRYSVLKWTPKPGTFGPDDEEKMREVLQSIGSERELFDHTVEIMNFVENIFIATLSTIKDLESESLSPKELMKRVPVLMERAELLNGVVDKELKRIGQLPSKLSIAEKFNIELYELMDPYGREIQDQCKKMGVRLPYM